MSRIESRMMGVLQQSGERVHAHVGDAIAPAAVVAPYPPAELIPCHLMGVAAAVAVVGRVIGVAGDLQRRDAGLSDGAVVGGELHASASLAMCRRCSTAYCTRRPSLSRQVATPPDSMQTMQPMRARAARSDTVRVLCASMSELRQG